MVARTLNLTHDKAVEQFADYRYRLPQVEFDLTECEGRAQIRSFSGALVGEFQVVFVRREQPALIDLVLPASSVDPGFYAWDLLIHSPSNESVKLFKGWVDIDAGSTDWNVYPPQTQAGDRLTQYINQQSAVIAQQSNTIAALQQTVNALMQDLNATESNLDQRVDWLDNALLGFEPLDHTQHPNYQLSRTPPKPQRSLFFVEGIKQRYGVDYVIDGNILRWMSGPIDLSYSLEVYY